MSEVVVRNPILRGFNPDPSICRAGDSFFIATSTFEWFPGVQIWESQDLQEWFLRTRPLSESRLLDMTGVPSSAGVWAPCLTVHDSIFYLAFTVVRSWRGAEEKDRGVFKDTLNFVTTAESIEGPWSDPVFLNASGFDPSLFHDDDKRSWFLNMEWDYRGRPTHFSGILLQEFDRESLCLFGPVRRVFTGTGIGCVEGPHLYKRRGWYYLVTAEGGTSYGHAVTIARSRNIRGPYEVYPQNPLLASWLDEDRDAGVPDGVRDDRLLKAGHASLCPLTEDEWILVHLSARPVPGSSSCTLGRETSLQRIIWTGDWPRVVSDDNTPTRLPRSLVRIHATGIKGRRMPETLPRYFSTDTVVDDSFDSDTLHPAFRFLRSDPGEDVTLRNNAGRLRLVGRESPVSTFRQTVVAMAVTAFGYRVETEVEFAPESFQHMAGLLVRYDERNQYYLRIAGGKRRTLGVIRFMEGKFDMPPSPEIELPDGPIVLSLEVAGATGTFSWRHLLSADGFGGTLPIRLDMLKLSDESSWPEGFTGTFVGMACHDLTGQGCYADFVRFRYSETASS